MKYFLGGVLNFRLLRGTSIIKRRLMTKNLLLSTHEIDKGVALSYLPEKYLYKIEVAKSNASAAAWAILSAQGIFPSAFKLSPTGN